MRRKLPNRPAAAGGGQGRDLYRGLAALAPETLAALGALDLTQYESRIFSQNGEDGVVLELLRRIGAPGHTFVEFGVGPGVEGNCVFLADVLAWSGLFIEAGPGFFEGLAAKYAPNSRVTTVQEFVNAGNIEGLFASAGVDTEPDVVSIDVDGGDWWIWRALRRYRPRLVVIEFNSNLPAGRRLVIPESDRPYGGDVYFGASLEAYEALAESKGYVLVHTDLTGTNAFFVRNDLAGGLGDVTPPRHGPNYLLNGLRMPGVWSDFEWIDLDQQPELLRDA